MNMNAQKIVTLLNIVSTYGYNLSSVLVESNKGEVTLIFLKEVSTANQECLYQDVLCTFYEREIACSIQEGRFCICISR
jgi:hypothetical protein